MSIENNYTSTVYKCRTPHTASILCSSVIMAGGKFILCVILLCAVEYCHGRSLPQTCPANTPLSGDSTTYIYKNGRIYTVDGPNWHQNPQQAMVVKKGIIEYVGTNSEALEYANWNSYTVNLRGKTVLPGIHDVHMHPLEAMSRVLGTCALPRGKGPENMNLKWKISGCAGYQKGTDWVLGWGHSIKEMLEHIEAGGRSPRAVLDEAFAWAGYPDTPGVMMEETSHSVWVNSAALTAAGIDANTQITGGIVMKDANGQPNGILLENAGYYIMDFALDPVQYPGLGNLAYNGLLDALWMMNKNGITSACDANVYWTRDHHEAYLRAEAAGKLSARMILDLWAYPHKTNAELVSNIQSLYSNDPSRLLRMSQVKVYADGLLDATTAAVLDPYLIDNGILPENKGMNYVTENRLTELIKSLQNVDSDGGFDFHIHAIGDRGVQEALNALEAAKPFAQTPRRHRLTHVELVATEDLPRFQQIGVIADAQVAGGWTLPGPGINHVATLVGPDKAADFIPVKSLLDNGADVTLSSDWDVSSLNPFVGMSHAMSRGDQSVDLKTAVEMYTINGAYVMRQECSTGALKPGYYADFITINQDIFAVTAAQVKNTKVLKTFLAGKQVY